MNWEITLESTRRRDETLSLTLAAGMHALILLWNPALMHNQIKPVDTLDSIEVVESAGGGYAAPEKVNKSFFGALKDMILTPKSDQLAHIAPTPVTKPLTPPAAAPTLQEKTHRPISMPTFQPSSQNDDLAALKNPDQIKAPGDRVPNMPVGGPTLHTKSFGGIKMKDLPFQVSGPESISASNVSNVPIALGDSSAKSGLGYTGPTLKETSHRRVGLVPGASGTGASLDTMATGSAAAPIAIGSGGSGTAPTGPATGGGGSLQQRGGGGFGGGIGSGRGSGIGPGVMGMPSAARELDSQMATASGASKTAKHKGFEIAGPLTNRPIQYKVIPEYPAWAEEQGIMGSVRLYFTVDSGGNVRSGIRVTKTTGYPALDQLGIDALKQWKFAPLAGASDEGQWGIITFNFSLSS